MMTTVLGTCDYCGKENCEVVFAKRLFGLATFACLSCRDERLELRTDDQQFPAPRGFSGAETK